MWKLLAGLIVYAIASLVLLSRNLTLPPPPRLKDFTLTTRTTCAVNYTSIQPVGTFKALLETTKCRECFDLQTVAFPLQKNLLGYRAPFYSRDAARVYRCRAQTRREYSTDWDPPDFRTCCLTDEFVDINETETTSFLTHTKEGKLWLEAIRRIDLLHSHAKRRLLFYSTWDDLLPSIPATQAFPDVNAHVFQSPTKLLPSTQVLLGRNAIVERNGRIIFATGDIFYPQRAPYSHIALMETWLGGSRFRPSREQRTAFLRKLDATKVTRCLAKIESTDAIYKCDDKSMVAVDTILVISQTLGNQMFHFLCENMPRLGTMLPYLLSHPKVFIHISCPEKYGYCLPLFDMLGIARSRLVRNNVVANTVLVPEGGRRHWPNANLHGLLALRNQVLTRNFAAEEDQCFAEGKRIRVALMKRKKTRLSEINPGWYDRLLDRFQNETLWQLQASFGLPFVEFVMYDDANQTMMNDATLQIKALRECDVIVGAHGAAFSWMTYLKRCSHFISFRSRTNSDIFEQLAVGLGMGFHHVRFENKFDPLFEQLQSSIFVAVQELVALRQESLPVFTVVLCEACSQEVMRMYLADFPAVVTRTLTIGQDGIGVALKDETLVQSAKRLFPQVTSVLWVNGNRAVKLAEDLFERWIPRSRFDAVALTTSLTEKPKLVLFNDLLLAEDFEELPKDRAAVAVIVCPFEVTATTTEALEYVVPIARQSEFLAMFHQAERFGAHYLQQQQQLQDTNKEFGIMISRNGKTWWRSFPPHAFVREPATNDSLACAGNVVALRLPFN